MALQVTNALFGRAVPLIVVAAEGRAWPDAANISEIWLIVNAVGYTATSASEPSWKSGPGPAGTDSPSQPSVTAPSWAILPAAVLIELTKEDVPTRVSSR